MSVPPTWETLGAKLLRGRYFTEAEDDALKPGIAVINQALARKFFPGENPIGQRIATQTRTIPSRSSAW
jgi:hypothetical protein